MNEDSIFSNALEIADSQARSAYLDRVCAGDADLRRRVDELLEAHFKTSPFMPRPAAEMIGELFEPPSGEAGTVIAGRYTLLERIGQGGMGDVWVAQQTEPVNRRVAVKLIKAGMDSTAVLGRFEAERQALALMDHPNIARVFDGGLTDRGRPFFVMELVNGLTLTRFCDEAKLTPRQRLELFVPICQAVQHAHQKGIVHRDLKPSNVLVTLYDARPVPKVIDFGVAKATGGKLSENAQPTQWGAVVGTLEYMAPESAGFSAVDVDTRADIYSLGIMLYELLTGLKPFDATRLKKAAIDEVLRIIREEDPPRPSTRLSTDDGLPSLAAIRQTEPKRLTALMRGELDWVVMKCLEKDRNRRYETANALSREIQRFLADEPVEARSPSAGYRLRKFVRRNRGAVVAVGLIVLALLGGITGATWGLIEARRSAASERLATEDAKTKEREAIEQKKLAEERRIAAQTNEQKALREKRIEESIRTFLLNNLLRQADPFKQAYDVRRAGADFQFVENPTIRELVDRAAVELTPAKIEANFPGEIQVQGSILRTMGETYRGIGAYAKAIEFLTRACDAFRNVPGPYDPETLATQNRLAEAYREAGQFDDAIALCQQVRDEQLKHRGLEDNDTLSTLTNLALAFRDSGKNVAEAIRLLKQVRDVQEKNPAFSPPDPLGVLHNLAGAYAADGKLIEAIDLYKRVLDLVTKRSGADNPHTLVCKHNLAAAYQAARQLPQAVELFKENLPVLERVLTADHPYTLNGLSSLGHALKDFGKPAEAIVHLERARKAQLVRPGPEHHATLSTMHNLAGAYHGVGNLTEAINLYKQVLKTERKLFSPDDERTITTIGSLAWAYRDAGDLEHALQLFKEAAAGVERRNFVHPYARQIVAFVIDSHEQMKQFADAEKWRKVSLQKVGETFNTDSTEYADELARLGMNLLFQKKWNDARELLEKCLVIREGKQAGRWSTFNAKSMLGQALLSLEKYAEAKSALEEGYTGMLRPDANLPPIAKGRLIEAVDRLVDLYVAWGKPEELAKWQTERAKYYEKGPPPREFKPEPK